MAVKTAPALKPRNALRVYEEFVSSEIIRIKASWTPNGLLECFACPKVLGCYMNACWGDGPGRERRVACLAELSKKETRGIIMPIKKALIRRAGNVPHVDTAPLEVDSSATKNLAKHYYWAKETLFFNSKLDLTTLRGDLILTMSERFDMYFADQNVTKRNKKSLQRILSVTRTYSTVTALEVLEQGASSGYFSGEYLSPGVVILLRNILEEYGFVFC